MCVPMCVNTALTSFWCHFSVILTVSIDGTDLFCCIDVICFIDNMHNLQHRAYRENIGLDQYYLKVMLFVTSQPLNTI